MENNQEIIFGSIDEVNSRNDFKNEKDLCDYLEKNIKIFSKTWLNCEVKEYKREWEMSIYRRFSARLPRIDFMIMSKDGKRIGIECKNNKNVSFSDISRSIGQLLAYSVLADNAGVSFDELIIVSSKIHYCVHDVIKKYNLPIRFLVISKEYVAEIK